MIVRLLNIVTVLCHGLFSPCLLINQSTATENFQSQELGKKADHDATDILNDYVTTEYGIFKIHNYQISWNDARNICLGQKAQLVVIDSAGEKATLLKYMKENNISSVWIGVHDLFADKEWTTIKGDRLNSLDYVPWAKGEPKSKPADQHCVALNENGLNNRPCGDSMNFICERNISD